MRFTAAVCAAFMGLSIPGISVSAEAVGCVRLLEYDKSGRVIGSKGSVCTEGAAGASQPSARPDGRRDPASSAAGSARTAARDDAMPGELLVLDPPRGFARAVRGLGFAVLERAALGNLDMSVARVKVPARLGTDAAGRRLLARYPGLTVDANPLFEAAERSVSDSFARAAIGWRAVPPNCGRGIRLGMIDAAIDLNHPALAGQDIVYRSFHGPDRRPAKPDHGTAIAAMMAGRPDDNGWGGLLPGMALRAANMFEVDSSGRVVGSAIGLVKAVDWMVSERVHALNLSIAGSDNRVTRKVFERARKKGLIMVAAAGNWGRADRPAFPAAYPHVVAVTAVGEHRNVYRHANRGGYIDFAAPGVALWTAVPGGGRFQSGTSFAAPYVSVLLAAEVARGVPADARLLRDRLRSNTVDLGAPGHDDVYGWGLIDRQPDCAG